MPKSVFSWIRISIFNLLVVASIGVILRFKIAFSLPFIDQKHLLHAHSHFAFAGWISQLLMPLMLAWLDKNDSVQHFKKYHPLLLLNLISAYGMLIGFTLQGYAFFSILCSTLSIFVSWIFGWWFWKDVNRIEGQSGLNSITGNWFKAAVFFNAISAIGAFALAFMMANKIIHQNWYLISIYFFLHFQYNGWFFFACMGLLMQVLSSLKINTDKSKQIFWLFSASCLPAYFLSALWLPIPFWLYLLIILSAGAQLWGWLLLIKSIWTNKDIVSKAIGTLGKWLLSLSAIALSIKLLLQAGSTVPFLSKLAFGFRPIVIAYLHLILLGVISIFLLGFLISNHLIPDHKKIRTGLIVFAAGVFINEFLLMIQGIAAIVETVTPFINELLFATACILFSGILWINLGITSKADLNHN